jgi:hypothetical protein
MNGLSEAGFQEVAHKICHEFHVVANSLDNSDEKFIVLPEGDWGIPWSQGFYSLRYSPLSYLTNVKLLKRSDQKFRLPGMGEL